MANTAFDHAPTITVPSPTVNNRVVTWNGTTGKVFHNAATVTIAAGVVAGVTALTVDNLTIDGNTITSTDTNGNITLTPHGTGSVVISKVDINDGAIDGTAIGAASASTVAGTTLSASTSLKTPLIEYTDGDDAITIADGGGITVAQNAIFTGTIRTPSILVKGTSNSVTLDADNPAAYTIILPNAAPTAAGKLLQSSGSSPYSTLEWGDAAGGGAITYVNGNTGSASTNNTSVQTNFYSVTGMTIAAMTPIDFEAVAYKDTYATASGMGFSLTDTSSNTTVIRTAATTGAQRIWRGPGISGIQSGGFWVHLGQRFGNYLYYIGGHQFTTDNSGGANQEAYVQNGDWANTLPTNPIASINITGIVGHQDGRVYIDELHVYTKATS